MKIHLTKKEYRLLLEILSVSEWVMHSHQIESNENCKQHDLLMQKLLSYYKDFKCEDLVEHDQVDNQYFQTIIDDDESPVNVIIKEYETEVFWEELTQRLARRDLIEKHGAKEVAEMEPMDRFEAILKESEKYHEEFEKAGIENLKIEKQKNQIRLLEKAILNTEESN